MECPIHKEEYAKCGYLPHKKQTLREVTDTFIGLEMLKNLFGNMKHGCTDCGVCMTGGFNQCRKCREKREEEKLLDTTTSTFNHESRRTDKTKKS